MDASATNLQGEHLDSERLGAYLEGQLTQEEEALVQRHLVHCQACTDLALELMDFLSDEEESDSRALVEAAALAHELLRRVPVAKVGALRSTSKWWLLAAASIAFIAFSAGLVGYNFGLSRPVESNADTLARALTIVELTDGAQHRGDPAIDEQSVGSQDGTIAVFLTPGMLEPESWYLVEITSETQSEFGELKLRADRTGTLSLSLPGERLSPGRYIFEIYRASGKRNKLVSLPLRVELASDKD